MLESVSLPNILMVSDSVNCMVIGQLIKPPYVIAVQGNIAVSIASLIHV